MQITGSKILILGGFGLVGSAVTRKLMQHNPAQIIIASLRKEEAESACKQLIEEFPNVNPNMFVPKFIVTTTNMGASDVFAFEMSAQGTFTVDWDDATVETIDRSATTSSNTYRHQYQTAGTRDIKFGGVATGYNENGASSFKVHSDSVTKVASLSGSLGGLMPTLGQTSALQPTFVNTFLGCTNLTSVPVGLFNGVNGNRDHMFSGTFAGTGLTGSGVPSGLFSNITGHASNLFASTFAGCTNLTSVPQGLFSSVSGADTQMFMYTFGNTGLTGQNALPSDLFSHVTGNAEALFQSTFEDCTSLTTIPGSLFSGITGSAAYMFENTFSGCSSLASIPGNLFSGVTGGANSLFLFTFANCSALTSLPAGLFSGINQAAQWMFNQTFVNCTHLTGYIPASMFSGLIAAGSPNIDGTEVYPSIPGMMNSMFANNGGLVGNGNCPTGTTQVTTGYEQYWGGAVACQPNS